jgi:hypothetical protein
MKIINPFFGCLLLAVLVSSCGGSSILGEKETEGNFEVFYKDGVTREEAQNLVSLLYYSKQSDNTEESTKSFQATRRGDTVIFRTILPDTSKAASVKEEVILDMAVVISDSIFNSAPVNVELTDNRFKTVRTITYKKIE